MANHVSADAEFRDPLLEFCRLCDRGERPNLLAFLATSPPRSRDELAAIVRADMRFGWSTGHVVRSETYFSQFPALWQDAEMALDIVYTEFLLRDHGDASHDLADWALRFPELAVDLARQIDFHRCFASPEPEALSQCTTQHDVIASSTAPGGSRQDGLAGSAPLPSVPGFEIIEPIGRGGMGVVYRARQASLNRDVALKFLHAADFASASDQQRFQREAASISRLRHPNFVQIYDFGSYRGCPYLVLEYVDGGTLADKLGGAPWTLDAAAACIEALATAAHHAHQLGIVHRDLKPNNVLITADGTLKIADLGLAKQLALTDESIRGRTESGALLGTPAYMAPEQLCGDNECVGAVTDVYALGVILYQLITGSVPFQAANLYDLLSQVRTQDPVAPRALRGDVSRDLETICLKCLQKEPSKRYAAASELAHDLYLYRGGKPIRARRSGVIERTARWAMRNPTIAALLCSVWLVLTAGLWTTSALYLNAKRHASRADNNYQVAMDAVDTYLADMSDTPDLQAMGMEPLRKQLLGSAKEFYDTLLAQQSPSADEWQGREVTVRLARAQYRLALIHSNLGDRQLAIQGYRDALRSYEKLVAGTSSSADDLYALALCHSNLGRNLERAGEWQEAEHHLREYANICGQLLHQTKATERALLPRIRHVSALAVLTAHYAATGQTAEQQETADEAARAYRAVVALDRVDENRSELTENDEVELCLVHQMMGGLFWQRGQLAQAKGSFAAMQSHCLEVTKRVPNLPVHEYRLAESWMNLALVNHQMGEFASARNAYDDADRTLSSLTRRYPLVSDYRMQHAILLMNRGGLEFGQSLWDVANAFWERSRALLHGLHEEFPDAAEYQVTLAQLDINMGNVAYSTGDYAMARTCYAESCKLAQSLHQQYESNTEFQETLAGAYHGLGVVALAEKDYPSAVDSFQQSRAIRMRLARDFPDVPTYSDTEASTLNNLGLALAAMGRLEAAEQAYQDACAASQKACEKAPDAMSLKENYADLLLNLGNFLVEQLDWEGALSAYETADALRQRTLDSDPSCLAYRRKLAQIRYNLGRVALHQEDPHAAEQRFGEALTLFRQAERSPDFDPVTIRDCLLGLARCDVQQQEYAQAIAKLDEAAQIVASESQVKASPGDEIGELRADCERRLQTNAKTLTHRGASLSP